MDQPDDALLAAARAGDGPALGQLLEHHQAGVHRFALRMCRDPDAAKDVVQDTLLAMARGLRDFRGASSISTWAFAIARSYCIKRRRRSKFAPTHERSLDGDDARDAAQLADPAPGPDDALARKELERALEQALDQLEPSHREVLLLRDVEGLTAPEVAEVVGITVGAVKSRLHRARLAVRAELAPLLGIAAETAPAPAGPCPDLLLRFSQHLEDEISADLCAEMERHLQTCGRCRGACASLRQTLALCRTAAAPVLPSAVQATVRLALRDFLGEPPGADPPDR